MAVNPVRRVLASAEPKAPTCDPLRTIGMIITVAMTYDYSEAHLTILVIYRPFNIDLKQSRWGLIIHLIS